MTITYTGRVSNARLCAFSRLLFCWKGSIYKLMYKEMLIFCALYAMLSVIYRYLFDEDQRRLFEKIALYCETFTNLIPLSFVLGFYVSLVVTRWWNQYMCIPWPDRAMLYVTTMIEGVDETGRLIRRTLMRYLTLASLIVFQGTSVRVKKRFPTMDHLVEAGIVTRSEVKMLEETSTPHGKWWIPFVWCCNLVRDARRQGRISDSYLMKAIIDEIMSYRGNLGMCYSYDWISVPLVYTQVTTLAVYTFFIGCLFGRQFLDPSQNYAGRDVDLYIPFFTVLQFFFYMGWLKVAEQLINPFGEDDDDFEMNWIIDRNMQVSLLTVDDLHGQVPPLEKDLYFGEPPPDYLPYTKSSFKDISHPHMGSTADLRISDEGMKVVGPLETIQEEVTMERFGSVPPRGTSPYLNTPRRDGSMNSPKYFRHLGGTGTGLLMSQNLMYGLRSPVDVRSRTSLHSLNDMDVISNVQVPNSLPVGTSSVVRKVTEKLGRWLSHHSSRSDLGVFPSLGQQSGMNSSSIIVPSRQTSATGDITFGSSTLPVLEPRQFTSAAANASLATHLPPPNSTTASSFLLPPLAEMFCAQSMFVADIGFESTVSARQDLTSTLVEDVTNVVTSFSDRNADFSPTIYGDAGRGSTKIAQRRQDDHHPAAIAGLRPGTDARTAPSSAVGSKTFSVERITDDDLAIGVRHLDMSHWNGTGGDDARSSGHRNAGAWVLLDDLLPPTSSTDDRDRSFPVASSGALGLTSSVLHPPESSSSCTKRPPPTIEVVDNDQKHADSLAASASLSSGNSSCSNDLYERPESNQCTVTSMTPLLFEAISNDDDNNEAVRPS